MSLTFACSYGVVVFCFVIAFLVDWIRLRAQVRKYLKYGVAVGVILIGLEVLTVMLAPADPAVKPVFRFLAFGLDFLKMVAFTTLGMYYCYAIGRPSFPIFLRRLTITEAGSPPPEVPHIVLPAPEVACTTVRLSAEPSPEQISQGSPPVNANVTPPAVPEVSAESVVFGAVAVACLGVFYSILLFWLAAPRISETARRVFRIDDGASTDGPMVQIILFLLLIAFGEEIVFRLGMQSFLARYLNLRRGWHWIAIAITTTIWTLGHGVTLEPAWVKPAQIFPMGLLLGWLCQRYGVESSILAHMLFNVALAFSVPNLIT